MLFLLSGASAAGKTTLPRALPTRVANLVVHELHEFADRRWDGEPGWMWRRERVERAVRRAGEYEQAGEDMLLTEAVFGELLAAPSATAVEGVGACLVDCADDERLRRIRARGDDRRNTPHQLWDHLAWALWLRRHAHDPQVFAGPIRGRDDGGWAWSRWEGWQAGDPRWRTFVIDTTVATMEESLEQLTGWVDEERRLFRDGLLPLAGDWASGT